MSGFARSIFYYYFVARYFETALRWDSTDTVLAKLELMLDQIYYDDYAHILMLVIYRTRQDELIRHLIRNANQIW